MATDEGARQTRAEAIPKVIIFRGIDAAYQSWLAENPGGFVLNARRRLPPSYMVLHRARCHTIRNYTRTAPGGAFTERGYVKICATTRDELRKWVKNFGRRDGSFSKICSLCS